MPKPLRLILLSFLMLFVELALIRWTGSNVVYLSYFSNFVLLGSFLGIGVGFLRAKARINLFPYAPVALAFFAAFVLLFPVQIDRGGERPDLLRRARGDRTAAVVDAAGHLRGRRGRHGDDRRGCRRASSSSSSRSRRTGSTSPAASSASSASRSSRSCGRRRSSGASSPRRCSSSSCRIGARSSSSRSPGCS